MRPRRAASTSDWIVDFERGIDKLDLRPIDANPFAAGNQAFAFLGAAAFGSLPGELLRLPASCRGT